MSEEQYHEPLYATLAFRIKASIIDSMILLALLILIPLTIGQYVNHPGFRAFLMYSPVLFLEPLLISLTGSTIGQRLVGITVVHQDGRSRLVLPLSFVRYFFKIILGSLSLAWMFFTRRHQAIHDRVVRTIVILSPQRIAQKPSFAAEGVRELEQETSCRYPSVLRRFIFFLIWDCAAAILLSFLIFGVTYLVSPDSISEDWDVPKSVERIELYLDGILLLVFASLGAKGLLPGARKIANTITSD